MKKAIVLDMDGTLADLYGYENWQYCLDIAMCTEPYDNAKPLVNMRQLNYVLSLLRLQGWKIIVNSWLSKNDNADFHKRIVTAKQKWLSKYRIVHDYAVFTKYGVDKHECVKDYDIAVLVDDNAEIRNTFRAKGDYALSEKNIVNELSNLLERAYDYEKERRIL